MAPSVPGRATIMVAFTAPRAPTLLREERERLHSEGILPIAKSTRPAWSKKWLLPGGLRDV